MPYKGRKLIDMKGQRFGRLLVLGARPSVGEWMWYCLCDCGNETLLPRRSLATNARPTRSCGCLARQMTAAALTKHGYYDTPTYRSWMAMLTRCRNPKHPHYRHYGGRGITVCDRWLKFENFLEDMGDRPVNMTLDRKRPDGNYEPSNCRWVTEVVQHRNTRTNKYVAGPDGRILAASAWAEHLGLKKDTFYTRIKRGALPAGFRLATYEEAIAAA